MIRAATIDDLTAILALERATPTAPHWHEADYVAMLDGSASRPRCLLVYADQENALAGFAAGAAAAGEGELETVVVAPAFQRQGIGRALCAAVMLWCRHHEAAEIRLEVREGSAGPIALYTSLGFVPVGRRAGYYADPVEDGLLMVCRP